MITLVPSHYRRIFPETWVRMMFNNISVGVNRQFFTVHYGKVCHPLMSSQVGQLLKQWTKDAGIELNLSLHCLRMGGLNWAHKAKATGEALKLMGGWASSVYLWYIDMDSESRVQVAKDMAKMKLQILLFITVVELPPTRTRGRGRGIHSKQQQAAERRPSRCVSFGSSVSTPSAPGRRELDIGLPPNIPYAAQLLPGKISFGSIIKARGGKRGR